MGSTTPRPPCRPSQLRAWSPPFRCSFLDLAWADNSTDETGFRVQRRTLPSGTFADITTAAANATSYTDTNVVSGTSYEYQVIAANAAGAAGPSNIATAAVPTPMVTTIAGDPPPPLGTGPQASAYADGAAAAARFLGPTGLAADASGNVFVSDFSVIRRSDGVTRNVTTFAGDMMGATTGYVDGAAGTARFAQVEGIVRDSAGDLIVADSSNHSIRRIDGTTGAVTTIAGAAPPTAVGGFVDGAAATARFNLPFACAVDGAGNIYVSDQNNHAIRRIDGTTGAVTTIGGDPPPGSGGTGPTLGYADGAAASSRFNSPGGIAVDAAGNVYVCDNNAIRRIDATTGNVTTVAGAPPPSPINGFVDGVGTAARFFGALQIALGPDGNLYVADRRNHAIRRVVPGSYSVTTIAGDFPTGSGGTGPTAGYVDGVATAARFEDPFGVAVDPNGIIYASGPTNNAIRRYGP